MNPFLAEYIGTLLMILLGNGVVANVVLNGTKGNGPNWMVITTGWALAVFVAVVVAGPYSGAHLNPVVSLSLAFLGKFEWNLLPGYILMQLFGAMSGALLVWLIYKDHFDRTEDEGARAACFFTGPAIANTARNLLSEILGTFVLIFVIFHFTDAGIKETNSIIGLGSIGALPVALLVWAIGLSLGGTTGYAINPVRDFGPRVSYFAIYGFKKTYFRINYAWIPIVGPVIGGLIAVLLFVNV
ncbi:major intrinsic protein [Pseudopedobacter saltans DSM 12145]|uniref:Major intrinsic protein n=1 Tax=Pseudopedobacter saltans (strain ATCC 51119 / DSM 12145 / JCM 21818 / CCUG 39354 / LMG 10337 / NBRC 100064 / NCIMB 13643) TaxID=762903 RepID=F0SB82_PSESL|nr:MIP/aquaporin family protein [Pseudopedobacter saltans]ADY53709.1 major intrinsic protein [Pseudopedobacter saltans DSM 12145]